MQLIKNNPYRTVGLLVGATAREQERQLKRLKQFIEAEQEPQDDFSFPTLGNLHRTIDSVNEAASKLNLDSDKMNAALFWFYKGNPITDEPAFDSLKEADQQTTTEIWSKLSTTGEVSQRNCSAFQNLSTLFLCNAFNGLEINASLLEKGISLKLKFLESDFIRDFKAHATDETYKTTKKELQLLFLTQIQSEVDKNGSIVPNKFLEILNKQIFSAKDDFLKGFVEKPIEQIEKKVDETRTKRKANKANALNIGKTLHEQTFESLLQIKSILGISNHKFSSISDKVSDEILQCGIDYFNGKDDKIKISDIEIVKELIQLAENIAYGNIAKQRCQENTNALNEIIANIEKAKYNDCYQLVAYLNEIEDQYKKEGFQYRYELEDKNSFPSIDGGFRIVDSAKVKELLKNVLSNNILIKIAKSNNNDLISSYLDVSEYLFNKQGKDFFVHSRANLFLENLSYNSKFKDRVKSYSEKSKPTVGSIAENVTGGCYIATMVYGDYDHPQVIILRQFRDNYLDKTQLGKWVIKIYYHFSPKLVEKIKDKKVINNVIRKTLSQFIKLIK